MALDGVDLVELEGFLSVWGFFDLGNMSLQRSRGREVVCGARSSFPHSSASSPVVEELLYVLAHVCEPSGHSGLGRLLQLDLLAQDAIGWHQEYR